MLDVKVGDWVECIGAPSHFTFIGQVLRVYGDTLEVVDIDYAGKANPSAWSQLHPIADIAAVLDGAPAK